MTTLSPPGQPAPALPRTPSIVNTLVAAGVIVATAAALVIFRADIQSPPSVAEFAPQAQTTIQQAPREQTGLASEPGGVAPPSPSPSPSPSPPSSAKPSPTTSPDRLANGAVILHCIGDPPRQIEDPQSAPCVPAWVGNNGGSTYKGVSDNEIKIAVAQYNASEDAPLVAFFNKRFELYGRHITLVDTGYSGPQTPTQQAAAAAAADQQFHAFGATEMFDGYYYQQELARRGLVSVGRTASLTDAQLAAAAPYAWSYPMTANREFANLGEWACKFVGHPAVHAGPLLRTTTRKFGVILLRTTDGQALSDQPLEQELQSCGGSIPVKVEYVGSYAGPGYSADTQETTMLQFKNAGVTTIFCLCETRLMGEHARAATSQGYYPEWVDSTYIQGDIPYVLSLYAPADQLQDTFGLTFLPRIEKYQDKPSVWAAKEEGASPPDAQIELTDWDFVYRSLLLLASGIQMAGPHLTPQTFGNQLHLTRFPNPASPIMEGAVGFTDGGYSMTGDAAEWWWSNTAPGAAPGDRGTICYVDGGKRYRAGGWPKQGDNLFQGTCDSGY